MGAGASVDAYDKKSMEILVHAPIKFADGMYEQFQYEELGLKPAQREELMVRAREDQIFPLVLTDTAADDDDDKKKCGDLLVADLKMLLEERYGCDHHTFTIHYEGEEPPTELERAEQGLGIHGDPFLDTDKLRHTGIAPGVTIYMMLYDPFVDDKQALKLLYKSLKGLEKRKNWDQLESFATWDKLNTLEGVQVTGTKTEKKDKRRVTHFDFHDFRLEGELPVKLPTKLKEFYLYNNKISGELPPFPVSLELIRGRSNRFTGELPYSLPRNLRILDLAGNYLEGTISDAPMPKYLKKFWVHHNNLEITNSQEEKAQTQCPKCDFQFFDKPATY